VLYVWVRVSFKGLCDVLGMNSAYWHLKHES
jgi:hypothetical protein